MLILSRKTGEELIIDGDILVRIVKTTGGRVTLGVDAPKHISIRRSEIPDEIIAKSIAIRLPK